MKNIVATAAFLLAGMCWAFEPSQPNPQTVDGQDTSDSCGMGWSVMDSPTILGATVRGTTNSILPPAFSMTFGTSGCEQHGFAKNEMNAVRYSVVNNDTLRSEMAEGQGEFLAGLAQTMGCGEESISEFSKVAQENYLQIAGSSSAGVELYKNVKAQVRKNAKLARTCSIG